MKKIDPEKFEWIGKEFIKLGEQNKNSVAFYLGFVQVNECGTLACHGGWACVIFDLKTPDLQYKRYECGAEELAKFLGFKSMTHYMEWAEANPEIWGNYFGFEMFQEEGYKSFGFDDEDSHLCKLEDIGKHYIYVAKRLIAFNIEESICE